MKGRSVGGAAVVVGSLWWSASLHIVSLDRELVDAFFQEFNLIVWVRRWL